MADYQFYYQPTADYYGTYYTFVVYGQDNFFPPSDTIEEFYPEGIDVGVDPWPVPGGGIHLAYPNLTTQTAGITFWKGQWFPVEPFETFNQKMLKTGTGEIAVYDSGYTDRIMRIKLGDLIDQATRKRLYKFLRYIVYGAKYKFEVLDETYKAYVVRYVNGMIEQPMRFWLKYDITLELKILEIKDVD